MARENKYTRTADFFERMARLGISSEHADILRRAQITLNTWNTRECNGEVERDETTGKTYTISQHSGRRYRTRDNETGALRRVDAVMAHYPELLAYHQGDPRGCALYVVKKSDVPDGADIGAYYSRGFAVMVGN